MKRPIAIALTSLALCASPALAGEALFENPAFDHADPRAGLEALLDAIEREPVDARVPILLSELGSQWPLVEGGAAQAHAGIARAVAAYPKDGPGWTLDALRSALASLEGVKGGAADYVNRVGKIQAQRGFVDRFLAVGPFGIVRNASLHQSFEVEVAANEGTLDTKRRYKALRGQRSWMPAVREPYGQSVSLARALDGEGTVVYALAHVRCDAAAKGYAVYRGPSARLWVNRALVTTVDRAGHRLDRSLRVPVELRAGWNRILIKMIGGARTSFALQLFDASGRPLAVSEVSDEVQPVEVGRSAATDPLPSWHMEVLAKETAPQRRALYARGLLTSRRGEEGLAVLDALQAADGGLAKQAWFALLHAQAQELAGHLPAPVRREQARAGYRHVVGLDPKSVRARQRLAQFSIQDDQITEGVLQLEAILKDYPGDVRTSLVLFDTLMRQEWNVPATKLLEGLPQGLSAVLRAKGRLATAEGRADQAQAAYEQLFAKDPSQTWVVLRRIDRAVAKGDRRAAYAGLAAYEKAAALQPGDIEDRRASVAASLGDARTELAALRASCEAYPYDSGRRLKLARRLAEDAAHHAPSKEEALQLLGEVLVDRPGHSGARALRDALKGTEDRFWEEWAPNLEEVLAGAPDKSHWPKASTVCLFDGQVTRIHPDTSSEDVVHQIWRLLDEGGIERYGSRSQSGELLEIRTITPDGESLEPIRAGRGAFQMPGLRPGAVVEHAFKTGSGPARFQLTNGAFYFQDPDLTEPFWLSRWVIMIHEDAPVKIIQRNMRREGISHKVEKRGPWNVHVFVARNQPRIQPEPNAPEREEFLPWVKVIEERTLEEVASYYRERGTRAPTTPSVKSKAVEIAGKLKTPAEKARALFAFVQEHVTRPSGGVTAAQILAARGGSKTTLLRGLLTAAEVPHELILASPEPSDGVDWDNPEPGQFNVPLLKVGDGVDEPLYIFAEGHRLAPFGRLPAFLSGASAYVCDPAGGTLEVLPSSSRMAEAMLNEMHMTLQPGGGATCEVRRVLPAYGLFRLKEIFGTLPEVQLRGWFAQQANQVFPGARVTASDVPRRDEVGVPLTITFSLQAGGVVRPRGDGRLELRGAVAPSQLKARFGSHRQRVFDLILKDLWASGAASRDEVTVDLGPYACPRLPDNVTLKNQFGQFSLVYSRRGNGVRIQRTVALSPGRVSPEDYPAFRAFLEAIDQAERAPLILQERK